MIAFKIYFALEYKTLESLSYLFILDVCNLQVTCKHIRKLVLENEINT